MPITLQMSVSVRLATSLEVVFISSGAGEGSVCCPVLVGSGGAALELGALEERTSSCQEGGACLGTCCIFVTYLRNKAHTCKSTPASGFMGLHGARVVRITTTYSRHHVHACFLFQVLKQFCLSCDDTNHYSLVVLFEKAYYRSGSAVRAVLFERENMKARAT